MATTRTLWQRAVHDWLPVVVVLMAVVIAWYVAAWALNAPGAIERVLDEEAGYTQRELFDATMSMERPLMPAPHQVAADLYTSLTENPLDSPRNLLFHVAVTAQSTLAAYRQLVAQWLGQGVSGVAIHAALVREHGFTGHYSSVRRLIAAVGRELPPDTTVRLTFEPGEAAQADFGAGPKLIDPATGELRRSWASVMRFAFLRHPYVEFV